MKDVSVEFIMQRIILLGIILSLVANFTPIQRNISNEKCCHLKPYHIEVDSTHVENVMTQESENESGSRIQVSQLDNSLYSNPITISLPQIKQQTSSCHFAYCIDPDDYCTDACCKKSKYRPSTNIFNMMGNSDRRPCSEHVLSSGSNTYKHKLATIFFPNFCILQDTSPSEIWIGLFTFIGILCLLKLTG